MALEKIFHVLVALYVDSKRHEKLLQMEVKFMKGDLNRASHCRNNGMARWFNAESYKNVTVHTVLHGKYKS